MVLLNPHSASTPDLNLPRGKLSTAALGSLALLAWAGLFGAPSRSEPDTPPADQIVGENLADGSAPIRAADSEVYGTVTLESFRITVPAFKIPRTPLEIMKVDIFFDLKLDFGFPSVGGAFVLTPGRTRQKVKNVAPTVRLLERHELARIPATSLDRTLLSGSDFDRAGQNRPAAPTVFNQGYALRGVNALVLLDGIPFHDPFGGWIPAAPPRTGLARVELVPGGGATVWGGGTLGGVVQFVSLPAKGKLVLEAYDPQDGGPPETKQVIHGTTQLTTMLGGRGSIGAEFVTSQPTGRGVLQIRGQGGRSAGYSLLVADQRGPIDRTAWSRTRWLEARWRQPLGKDRELVATVRDHDETGGNGTPYQQGGAHGTLASLAIASNRTSGFAWNALAYAQDGSSANRFSAVSPDRTQETPVIDRFAVPTRAYGATWSGAWRHFADTRTHAGVDLRFVRGETRENDAYLNGEFTRQRFAGGSQGNLGVFVWHERAVTPTLRATAGARLDAGKEFTGHRRETDRSSGVMLLDQRHAPDARTDISPSVGLVWQPNRAWRWRVHGQQSFRRPTLGERYQSSGRYDGVTAENPDLRAERNTTLEVAAEYSFHGPSPSPVFTAEARVFQNVLIDAVSTVTLARGSGEFPWLDALPAGYRGAQRINLDRSRLQGFELLATWQPNPSFALEGSLLWNEATILHSTVSPGLRGRRLAEVSRHTAAVSVRWQASPVFTTRLRMRSTGRQFIDNENTLPLRAAVVADLGVNYLLNEHADLYLTGENLTATRIEHGRDRNGLVYLGAPRNVQAGLRLTW